MGLNRAESEVEMKTVSLDVLKITLRTRNANGESWAKMGREYDVNPAVIWRIANEGYNPKNIEVRERLCLPELVTREVYRDGAGRFTKDTR